jgi:signal transduction histidine kinase
MVREVSEQWHELMATRRIAFTCDVADDQITILGDHRALQRLLNVLLDNAMKYTPSPGTIDLLLDTTGSSVLIRVRDSGIGIALEEQEKIFERFYRVDKARSGDLKGAGIGLAIAQWIVQQHKGSIMVQSSPGKGSTFVVTLPLQEQLQSAPTASAVLSE